MLNNYVTEIRDPVKIFSKLLRCINNLGIHILVSEKNNTEITNQRRVIT